MIRDVKPLSVKQWMWLHERMKEGPTEEQTKKMKEIKKRVQKLLPVTE